MVLGSLRKQTQKKSFNSRSWFFEVVCELILQFLGLKIQSNALKSLSQAAEAGKTVFNLSDRLYAYG